MTSSFCLGNASSFATKHVWPGKVKGWPDVLLIVSGSLFLEILLLVDTKQSCFLRHTTRAKRERGIYRLIL